MEPHRATLILVLGILSLAMYLPLGAVLGPVAAICPIVGIVAWIMGNRDLAEMDSGRMDPSGRDTTNAGRVLGIVATCMLLVMLLAGLAVVVVQIVSYAGLGM